MVGTLQSVTSEASILPLDPTVPSGQALARKHLIPVNYLSQLNINSHAAGIRLSGIVCTIGPATQAVEKLVGMLEAGMNVARMNFSHGNHDFHQVTISNCREAAQIFKEKHGYDPCLAIALDTKGPEIRTGVLDGDDGTKEVTLEIGDLVKLTTDDQYASTSNKDVVFVDYLNLPKVMDVGKRIYIDDGLISLLVCDIGKDFVVGEVENGGNLGSKKGCNLPGTNCDLPAVSEQDIKDLQFGVEQGVDMVFASFIRDAAGVNEMRKVLGKKGKNIFIIPKIENQQGINNIDEIITVSDGIMVARGDMGIEIPPEKVFIAQKMIVAKCNKVGKPVICATQMLDSMIKKPRATRAECSDVANAVLDGSDCVMLSGETAKGHYPIQCIQTMAVLAREAEACLFNEKVFVDLLRVEREILDTTASTAVAAVLASHTLKAAAIIAVTSTGKTAKVASKFRPLCPILAVTKTSQVARQLHLHRGVVPILYQAENPDLTSDVDARIKHAMGFGKDSGFLKTGDKVVCISGCFQGTGSNNTMTILDVK